jgi:hypothetical protein
MIQANEGTALSVRRTSEIEATSDLAGRVDRYLIESADSGGLVDLLEQILPPRALAAPVHRHSREDEYSVVLEGRLGVFQTTRRFSQLQVTSCSSHAGIGTHSGMPETDSCASWR